LNTLSTEKAVLNEKFESLFEIDRSKDLMNELDFLVSAKEVTEATKKLKKKARAVALIAFFVNRKYESLDPFRRLNT
jgi:hypothetical protein